MAFNFNIHSLKTRDCLHLKLSGDFDGTSAHELINALTESGKGIYDIFIDTDDLTSIHPFGIEVFQKNLGLFRTPLQNLVFIGTHGNKITVK